MNNNTKSRYHQTSGKNGKLPRSKHAVRLSRKAKVAYSAEKISKQHS